MIKLSIRLLELEKLITGSRVADIGCDHGKVIAKALLTKKIDYAILSDISKKSANKASNLLNSYNLTNYEIRVGNGLEVLNKSDNISTVIISGMGGDEIINIISKSNLNISKFILQPQHNEIGVKKFMVNLGYSIVFDKIIKDGLFYNLMVFEKNNKLQALSEYDLLVGANNFVKNNTDFCEYLDLKIKKLQSYLTSITDENIKLVKQKELNIYILAQQKIGELNL